MRHRQPAGLALAHIGGRFAAHHALAGSRVSCRKLRIGRDDLQQPVGQRAVVGGADQVAGRLVLARPDDHDLDRVLQELAVVDEGGEREEIAPSSPENAATSAAARSRYSARRSGDRAAPAPRPSRRCRWVSRCRRRISGAGSRPSHRRRSSNSRPPPCPRNADRAAPSAPAPRQDSAPRRSPRAAPAPPSPDAHGRPASPHAVACPRARRGTAGRPSSCWCG